RRRRGLPRDRGRDPDAHGAQVPGSAMRFPLAAALLCASGSLLLAPAASRADWLQPDGSYREAQLILKMAARDTAGHGDDPGRLERMPEGPIYQVTAGPDRIDLPWTRAYPVPLVRVKLNGQSVLMALDTGSSDLLIDESAARRYRVDRVPGQRIEFWSGSRVAVRNAMAQRLEIGAFRIERLPAGTLSLRKWSIEVNPQSEPAVGVIGLNLMRRFTPTMDFKNQRLELRRPSVRFAAGEGAARVPFQIWGENELTVYGSLAG